MPLNIGTGIGTTIKQLAETIKEGGGFRGEIVWDASKPDGAMKKVLDIGGMKSELRWLPKTGLREGIERSVEWYISKYV